MVQVIPDEDIFKCVPTDLSMRQAYLCAKKMGAGEDTVEFWKIMRAQYMVIERDYQKTYFCSRCRWRDRYQKCTSCGRKIMLRDLFEEEAGE